MTTRATIIVTLLLLAAGAPALAEPPAERSIVAAVADDTLDRILVRWDFVEGRPGRYAFVDVVRRDADGTDMQTLNPQPVGAMTTTAAVEALFGAPGSATILAEMQARFGVDYAATLLQLAHAPDGDTQAYQRALLPDLNWGAAIVFGLGFMDDTVVSGQTYVYEVWGVDAVGTPVERLGRATATAGQPAPLATVASTECVDSNDPRGDMAVLLRFAETPAAANEHFAGYDVFRAPYDEVGGSCPPVAPGAPGVVKVNQFPTDTDSPGNPALGRQEFQANCSSCHQAADARLLPPDAGLPADNGIQSTTRGDFHVSLDPNLKLVPAHQTDPGAAHLPTLGAETIDLIYEWLDEFQFRDGGEDTPSDPLVEGGRYCYSAVPRNLLGQYGTPGPVVDCPVEDLLPPDVPSAIAAARLVQGDHEVCEISWDRNAAPGDDTVSYRLARRTSVPRYGDYFDETVIPTWNLPQPGSGERVTFTDSGLSAADAGQPYFYAVQAFDDAGNRSGYGGWVPCIPRDIVPPGEPQLVAVQCCDDQPDDVCREWNLAEWLAKGGEKVIVSDPRVCPVHVYWSGDGDTAGVRVERSFDGSLFLPGPEEFQSPLLIDFAPLADSKLTLKLCPFDDSGNVGPCGSPFSFFLVGKKRLPAPIINQVAIADELNGEIVIRFRSLNPDILLGFALYQQPKPTDPGGQLELQGDLVERFVDGNLSTTPLTTDSEQWVVQGGAQALDQRIRVDCTEGLNQGETLCYDPLKKQYHMRVTLGQPPSDVVLKLMAVGWTGYESESVPYVYGGLQPNDGVLAWPRFREANYFGWIGEEDLFVTYDDVLEVNHLAWNAHPDNCSFNLERPFIVYRKRGTSPLWEQVSPPFGCNLLLANPAALSFDDPDVQPGFTYTYRVFRLGRNGEFSHRYGPTPVSVP